MDPSTKSANTEADDTVYHGQAATSSSVANALAPSVDDEKRSRKRAALRALRGKIELVLDLERTRR